MWDEAPGAGGGGDIGPSTKEGEEGEAGLWYKIISYLGLQLLEDIQAVCLLLTRRLGLDDLHLERVQLIDRVLGLVEALALHLLLPLDRRSDLRAPRLPSGDLLLDLIDARLQLGERRGGGLRRNGLKRGRIKMKEDEGRG